MKEREAGNYMQERSVAGRKPGLLWFMIGTLAGG